MSKPLTAGIGVFRCVFSLIDSVYPLRIVADTWQPGIEFVAISDVGMRRANNQDSYAIVPSDSAERFERCGHLFVVADGMGAHAAGELASRMAAEKIPLYYLRGTNRSPADSLRSAVEESNAEIHRRGQENPEFFNMGTTASSLVLLPEGALIAHVGDSRIYRLRDGKLEQLTFDHSLVWEMQASGQVHPDSALRHSIPKNVITRSLGPSAQVAVDIEGPFAVRPNDCFLLCSDGLSGQVSDDEIGPILASMSPERAARILIDLANLRGGPDNSTVIIVKVGNEIASASKGAERAARRMTAYPLPWPLLGTAGFCLVAGLTLGWFGSIGPMVVALILAAIAAIVAVVQIRGGLSKLRPGGVNRIARAAPYSSCSARPNDELLRKLREMMVALRTAAHQRGWSIDWSRVEAMTKEGDQHVERSDLKRATVCWAEAVVETMAQLRDQNRRVNEPDR